MKSAKTQPLFYFRPNQSECELLTAKDKRRIERLWGKNHPWNYFETADIDHNYGTGIHKVTNVLAIIQCDQKLNERASILIERIKKGLKRSTSRGGFEYVEQNVAWEIVADAINIHNKTVEKEDQYNTYSFAYREIFRWFGLPYKSLMEKVSEQETDIKVIPKPERTYKVKFNLDGNDPDSSYKCYYVKGQLSYSAQYDNVKKTMYRKFPYLGKLHQSSLDKGFIQIYVYDYSNRHWALQNIIDYLVRSHNISLKESK